MTPCLPIREKGGYKSGSWPARFDEGKGPFRLRLEWPDRHGGGALLRRVFNGVLNVADRVRQGVNLIGRRAVDFENHRRLRVG